MASISGLPITPKENFKRAARRQDFMWLPMRADTMNFAPRIYPDYIAKAQVMDAKPYDGPLGGPDIFGVQWKYVDVVGGSMVEPGNPFLKTIGEWREKIRFPDLDSWDWEASAAENRELLKTDKLVFMRIHSGMFERLISFLDFENAVVALIDEDEQDEVKALFQALADFYKKLIDKFVEHYAIDSILMHDDWGSQRAPFFSLATCREMIVPYIRQVADHCHARGLIFELHCCGGKNEPLVPAMVECGADMWGGQPTNDKKMLVDTYGDRILIGIHSPYTVPYKPPQPAPADDAALRRQLEAYLEPYAATLREKPFFVMDIRLDPRVRETLIQLSSAILSRP